MDRSKPRKCTRQSSTLSEIENLARLYFRREKLRSGQARPTAFSEEMLWFCVAQRWTCTSLLAFLDELLSI